jgi:hypothetical protein
MALGTQVPTLNTAPAFDAQADASFRAPEPGLTAPPNLGRTLSFGEPSQCPDPSRHDLGRQTEQKQATEAAGVLEGEGRKP